MLNTKIVLITGGTGSFGSACTKYLLENFKLKKLIIFSRDENKQYQMAMKYQKYNNIRFLLGDVRDLQRLNLAMKNVDYVIHAAALKHVPIAEYNPIECINTNILGAQNIIVAALQNNVKKILALSTDKATNPINLYGATKLAAEKLFLAANALTGKDNILFSVVRYGNVISSRGSVIPYFKDLIEKKEKYLPITDLRMTRFFLSIEDSVKFVLNSLSKMEYGEVFIPKLPSVKIIDLAKTLKRDVKFKIIGLRPGEKIDESLCSKEENRLILEFKDHFRIFSNLKSKENYLKQHKKICKVVSEEFYYSSINNPQLLNLKDFKKKFSSI